MKMKIETGIGINKKQFYRGLWRQEKMDLRTCRRKNKSSWKIPRIPPLIKSFAFSGFSYLQVTEERWPFFWLTVRRSIEAYCYVTMLTSLTSLHLLGILSSHIVTRRVRTVQWNVLRGRVREHIHTNFVPVYYDNCPILLLLFISHCASVMNLSLSEVCMDGEKHGVYRIRCYLGFQTPARGWGRISHR